MAQCLKTRRPEIVRLGDQNLLIIDDGAQPKEFNIAQVITHPQYNRFAKQHNIGLVKLDKEVAFTDFIRPACLPQSNQMSKLKAVALGNDLCIQLYGEDSDIVIDNNHICAGVLRGGADTCAGDSGRFDSGCRKFQ